MAGLIAAHGRSSGAGALGIAPAAKILPIIDSANSRRGNADLAAAGIGWATRFGVQVINISASGGPTPRLRAAVEAALAADIVVVAAVGNRPDASAVQFPAFYPGVLAVGAVDRNGNHADISVTGPGIVLSAPGVDIHSTSRQGRYQVGTGTSDATAIVSGAVALVRSRFPDLSATEVVNRLTATATDKGPPGWDEQYGYGVLNIVAALTADLEATTNPTTAAPTPQPEADNTLPLALGVLAVLTAGVGVGVIWARTRRRRREPVA